MNRTGVSQAEDTVLSFALPRTAACRALLVPTSFSGAHLAVELVVSAPENLEIKARLRRLCNGASLSFRHCHNVWNLLKHSSKYRV